MGMIKKFNEFIRESVGSGFDWSFVISLDLISIIYSGGEYFNDLEPSQQTDVKRLFDNIVDNVNADIAEIKRYGITVSVVDDVLTFEHVNEKSLMYIVQNIVEKWGLQDVNVLYVNDIERIAPEELEDDLMGDSLWDTYQDYLYDNLEH